MHGTWHHMTGRGCGRDVPRTQTKPGVDAQEARRYEGIPIRILVGVGVGVSWFGGLHRHEANFEISLLFTVWLTYLMCNTAPQSSQHWWRWWRSNTDASCNEVGGYVWRVHTNAIKWYSSRLLVWPAKSDAKFSGGGCIVFFVSVSQAEW